MADSGMMPELICAQISRTNLATHEKNIYSHFPVLYKIAYSPCFSFPLSSSDGALIHQKGLELT
jgi:hypothetical protein